MDNPGLYRVSVRVRNLSLTRFNWVFCFVLFFYFHADSRKSSEVRAEDIKNVVLRMDELLEDDVGEEAAMKEEDGFVNILKQEKTVRSSINSERSSKGVNDRRREEFRMRKRSQGSNAGINQLVNGCIMEDSERKVIDNELKAPSSRVNNNNDKQLGSFDDIKKSLEAFQQMLPECDSSSSGEGEDDYEEKGIVLKSGIPLCDNNGVMYPTLTKDKISTSLSSESLGRKGSTASTDSGRTESDEERDVKRSESFASFGSSIKVVQQRQVGKIAKH